MLGTLLHIDAPTASAIANYRYLLFGLIMIIMMAWRPQGILPSKRRAQELHPEDEKTLEEEDQSLWAVEHGIDGSGHDL
jgi:branched-chain amino acid transport system permease protein